MGRSVMVTTHLRRHCVAYLALFVALGGTSYAAASLPKGSVGAKQLKKGAVTSVKVKDGSLQAADFQAGALPAGPAGPTGPRGPAGPVWGGAKTDSDVVMRATPTGPDTAAYTFTLPAAGPTFVGFWQQDRRRDCSVGNPFAGVYVDGQPLAGASSQLSVTSDPPTPINVVGTVTLSAGTHTVTVRDDCPIGANGLGSFARRYTWTVLLLGSS